MENALAIASIAGPAYIIIGLSLFAHPHSWHKLMKQWTNDHYSLFGIQLFVLILGLVMLKMYHVWAWNVWLIVTLLGWGATIKGALYFLLPGNILKDLMKTFNKEGWMYFSALFAIIIGLVLTYYSYLV